MLDLASLCPYPMPVRAIRRETADVWTLELQAPGDYHYLPGQYALVGIDGGRAVRAYTLSSSPGISDCLSITVRRLDGGLGSQWLTGTVQPGQLLQLSAAQGEFVPQPARSDYLFLAGGCGITPVMAMTRWLLTHVAAASLVVLYNVRTPRDIIFADEWTALAQRYPAQLRLQRLVDCEPDADCRQALLSRELLQELVPDIASRVVMSCGPEGYMALAGELALALGVPAADFHHEAFRAAEVAAVDGGDAVYQVLLQPWGDQTMVAAGGNLLAALEAEQIPLAAACRTGVCGTCKVRVLEGEFSLGEQSALSAAELADGYALACCCSVHSDLVIEGV